VIDITSGHVTTLFLFSTAASSPSLTPAPKTSLFSSFSSSPSPSPSPSPSSSVTPYIRAFSEQVLVLSTPQKAEFFDFLGTHQPPSITVTSPILASALKFPFLILANPRGVEIFNMATRSKIQSIPMDGVLAASDGANFFVVTPNRVEIVAPSPIDQQVFQLLSLGREGFFFSWLSFSLPLPFSLSPFLSTFSPLFLNLFLQRKPSLFIVTPSQRTHLFTISTQ
jgi:hypothetical protein